MSSAKWRQFFLGVNVLMGLLWLWLPDIRKVVPEMAVTQAVTDRFCVTLTSHEPHGISNHRQLEYLFNKVLSRKGNINESYYWPFVRGIHRCPVDFHYKEPVMWKACQCHGSVMFYSSNTEITVITDITRSLHTGSFWVESARVSVTGRVTRKGIANWKSNMEFFNTFGPRQNGHHFADDA